MKLSLLIAVVGLVSQICAESDYTLIDAADMLYFYTVYELDVEVFGVGKGYIALGCRGTGTGNRCTYNEFVSYIETRSATPTPTIYDIKSKWEFTLNSITDIMTATFEWRSTSINEPKKDDRFRRLRDGRKTYVGVWTDLGYAVEKGRIVGVTNDISITRRLANINGVLASVAEYRRGDANTKLMDHLKGRVTDVVWETVNREAEYRTNYNWQEIEWEKTIQSNPAMKDPTSELFKEVTYQLERHLRTAESRNANTINAKVASTIKKCFVSIKE
ncbi:hypothetical protein CGCF415_v007961 [Colletotrichum fructicola]|nr:hypothetical protein CGCF415_v007961 [Colletotrichum fructicola]KAF4934518.1 hypothetical protein CGCF245_v008530 [Colletotrichum fructicola]